MKNESRFGREIYKAPKRPMMIDGPAIPRWQPLRPREDWYYRVPSKNAKPEDTSEPVLNPIELEGVEEIGESFSYRVRTRTDIGVPSYPDIITLALDKIVGTPITVYIDIPGKGQFVPGMPGDTGRGNIGFHVREISGIVRDARFIKRDDRSYVYDFYFESAIAEAKLGNNYRIWQNVTVIDVIRDLLAPYPIEIDWRIAGPIHGDHYPVRDLIRQHFESDFTCFQRLCEWHGLFYFFTHTNGGHKIVVSDTPGSFRKHGPAYETIRYLPGQNKVDEETIEWIEYRSRQTIGKATVGSHDYTRPRAAKSIVPLRASSVDPRDTARAHAEHYGPFNSAQPLQGSMGLHGQKLDLDEQAKQAATVRMQAGRAQGLRVKGFGHIRGLLPGSTFRLIDCPFKTANREYIVVRVELHIVVNDQASRSEQVFSVDTKFELHPIDASYFRLPIATPWPHVGAETAIVCGPNGSEVFTDAYGRIVCRLVSDREGKYDENAFIWVRVAQSWRGPQMGTSFIPRIGHEVTVDYMNGDPDQPMIRESVTNANNLPPWPLANNHVLSGIRSKELGGFASNHLALDDTKGMLQAQLGSDHGKSSLSLGYIARIDEHGRGDERGEGFELRTDRHGAIRAALGMIVTTFARNKAAGKIKEIGETVGLLTQARDLHESATLLAQQRGAQDASGDARDVLDSMRDANTALRGKTRSGPSDFPEVENPDIALSSAANAHIAATDNAHLSSGRHTALTAGGHLAIATGQSLFASVRSKLAFYVQKGMTLIASGRVHIESRMDAMKLLSQGDMEHTSTQGWIRLSALKGIELHVNGSVVRITGDGVTIHTGGEFVAHAANHATNNPDPRPIDFPVTQDQPGKLVAHHVLVDDGGGFPIANQPYRIVLDDGQVVSGFTNKLGEMELATSNLTSFGLIEQMSQSEPDKVISTNSTSIWRERNSAVSAPAVFAEQRSIQVGGETLSTPAKMTTTSGTPATFLSCDPMNFGLRSYHYIGKAKPTDVNLEDARRGGIEYSTAKNYVESVKKPLCAIRWQDLAEMPLAEQASKVIPIVKPAIWRALQDGPFGLPPGSPSAIGAPGAMPDIRVLTHEEATALNMRNDAVGSFISTQWMLVISEMEFSTILKSSSSPSEKNEALIRLVDAIYHEARHCQQDFLAISLIKSHPGDYEKFKNLDKFYERYVQSNVYKIASATTFPPDERVRVGIHAMLIFEYYWAIMAMKDEQGWTFLRDDLEIVEAEVCQLRHVTPEVARKMANHKTGYRTHLHEEDAFFCGNVVQDYWRGYGFVRNPGTCTDDYSKVYRAVGAS